MSTGTLARITIAPVKALALVALDEADLRPTGVPGDRRYALLDAQHRLANGKRLGPLVRIRPEIGDGPESLVLHLPDGRAIGGPVELGEVKLAQLARMDRAMTEQSVGTQQISAATDDLKKQTDQTARAGLPSDRAVSSAGPAG